MPWESFEEQATLESEAARVQELYDAREACKALDTKLSMWSLFCLPTGRNSYTLGRDITAETPGAVPYLWQNPSEPPTYWFGMTCENKDERPYFKDPISLGFDPEFALRQEFLKKDPGEEGVKLAEVWGDPLARTLWLAVKARHITSQYFRGACIEQAHSLRQRPPRTIDDFHVETGEGFASTCSYYFRLQLYPYVLRILIDEGRWPYFTPPRSLVSPHVLRYEVNI